MTRTVGLGANHIRAHPGARSGNALFIAASAFKVVHEQRIRQRYARLVGRMTSHCRRLLRCLSQVTPRVARGFDINRTLKNKSTATAVPGLVEVGDIRDMPVAAQRHIREAARALNSRAWKEAERAITTSLVYAQQHPEPHRLLGILMHRLGRSADAITSFREALRLRPEDASVLAPMAQAQADANDIPGAIETLRKLIAQGDDANAMYLLAHMLDRHGELDEALPILQRVVALDAGHARARLQLARCLFYSGRVAEAEAQFRHLLRSGR